ncbi:amidase [Pseudooceanicola sediminis]|uniref:Amidase n=2 Tax=Pseudooceanicola sediminis TaxID=2211117 RepID=A0A399J070_9RHOB|nr:amidase [Puniceibacterium sp. HSS470]RII38813.1 amidase [Pseudooceanicola sediminis]
MTVSLDLGTSGGPRVAVKECLAIEGLPTRAGSAALADAPPALAHAQVVQTLLDTGCQIVGRANMHELAYGMTGANAHTGTPQNPRWPDRIPGGSSSGSAVLVAQGAVDFAVGTDTGGSIRQPAGCCGVFGLKPTFGRISRAGATPVASTLDSIGPFAATAPMLTRAMSLMDPTFQAESLASPPSLALLRPEAASDITASFDAATKLLHDATLTEATLPSLDAAYHASMTIIGHEIAAEFGALAASNATLGADVRARILNGTRITARQLADAEAVRTRFTAEIDALLDTHDAILLPLLARTPPTWAVAADPAAVLPMTRFIRQFNMSGHPALALPTLTADGLPAGLQLIGAKGADARLCAIAEWIAARTPEEETA